MDVVIGCAQEEISLALASHLSQSRRRQTRPWQYTQWTLFNIHSWFFQRDFIWAFSECCPDSSLRWGEKRTLQQGDWIRFPEQGCIKLKACKKKKEKKELRREKLIMRINYAWSYSHYPSAVTIITKQRCVKGMKGGKMPLLLTATHSFKSSPSGNMTAIRRLPLPSVASACFNSSYWCEPSGIFFLGLNVLDERFPLSHIWKRKNNAVIRQGVAR